MPYFVIVFADTVQLFSFDSEEDAARHAEEWWSAFPDIKTLVAKVTSENIISGDLKKPPHLKGRQASRSASVNPRDLDLLACLEHLVTEGGPDNFLNASRGGIAMDFSAGKGDTEIRWGILQDKGISGGHWGPAQWEELEHHQFARKKNNSVDAYFKQVRAENLSDLLAISREACELMREVFEVPNEQNWHLELNLQYV